MTYTQDPYSRFEEAYRSALRQMRRKKPKDEKIFALASTEEACENSGAVEFTPDWSRLCPSRAAAPYTTPACT